MKDKNAFKKLSGMQLAKEIRWLLEEKYKGKQNELFFSDVTRLKKGEPVDYVIGFTQFLDCKIDLTDSTLIPRAETEFWMERAIRKISKETKKETVRCLDIFSGSGCIGISILHNIRSSIVDFGDIQTNCLDQIQKNIESNNINASRTNIYNSNCFEGIPQKKYDYIFANPPYVAFDRKKNMQKSVIEWEPHEALFSKDNGLYYIKKIIQKASGFLEEDGVIFIEFDSWQKEDIEKLVPKDVYIYTFWKDQFEKWRTVVLQKTTTG